MKVKHMAIFVILVLMLWTSAACDMPSTGASDASPAPTPAPLAVAQTTRTSVVSAEG